MRYYYGPQQYWRCVVTVYYPDMTYRSRVVLDSREHPFGDDPEGYLRKNHIVQPTDHVMVDSRRFIKTRG